MGSSVIVV